MVAESARLKRFRIFITFKMLSLVTWVVESDVRNHSKTKVATMHSNDGQNQLSNTKRHD